jgi:hypothetical protein
MRNSSLLTAVSFIVSIAASTSAMATNFSGIPSMPQEQAQNQPDPTLPKLAQFPADPPVQMHLNDAQSSPYDSPDFVVPPYEIQP